ncbi:flagellar hook-length control protein FliK [Fuscovulum ytuae]|uniref:Flagellar hook-length control protein FliK n=1 Tax=Fuscovulum ytuae TaxID=3042299 RepID=A0ABY8Q258_9RHOB|nr:flagellar hook-length control protein FliK [Fuscovulum sp. YMD61]WGV14919.1 flagellar hook-length control protein FliK [Fuscovulum sp. YMD61]
MTLPVTLAETPALPRKSEAAASAAAPEEGGEARFAETLAGAMGPEAKGKAGKKADETVPAVEVPTDAEAMLADLEQRAVAIEGEGATPSAGLEQELAVAGTEAPVEGAAAVIGAPAPLPDDVAELPVEGSEVDLTSEEAGAEEDIPLDLPMAAMLAAALPVAPTGEAAAPTVQPTDASVEAARRAMAASMTMPGLAKADKDGKGPLEGPEAASEAETATEGKDEIAMGKVAPGAELRPVAAGVAPVAAEPRNGGEARRETAEITLAALGAEKAEVSAPTTSTGGSAALVGAQPFGVTAGGPIHLARPGWEVALADRIAAELSGDGQEIELDLAPETLGHLKIKLEVVDGLAQVRIVTETTEAARLFQQAEHRLSESLSRAGLSLGGQDAQSRDAQNGQGQAGQGGNGPGDRGPRPRSMELHFDRQGVGALAEQAGRAGRGLVNLIA